MAPETKILFGFPIDMDPRSNELLESKRFQLHATYFIKMLDSAFNLYVLLFVSLSRRSPHKSAGRKLTPSFIVIRHALFEYADSALTLSC